MAINFKLCCPYFFLAVLFIPIGFIISYYELQLIQISDYSYEKSATTIDYLLENLQRAPINNIKIVPIDQNCHFLNEEIVTLPAFSIDDEETKLLRLLNWTNSKICITRSVGPVFLDSQFKNCPSNYKKCSD